jgi:putative component of toxin-antitoxin plasmid stabilization module
MQIKKKDTLYKNLGIHNGVGNRLLVSHRNEHVVILLDGSTASEECNEEDDSSSNNQDYRWS